MLITCSSAQDSSFLKVGEEGEAGLRTIKRFYRISVEVNGRRSHGRRLL